HGRSRPLSGRPAQAFSEIILAEGTVMRRLIKSFLTLSCCWAIVAAQDGRRPATSELDAAINGVIQRHHLTGLSIGIVKDWKLVYAKGFGVARLAKEQGGGLAAKETANAGKPITTHSLFHMASVTKTFVATAIMQLVEQGKIDLDAP